MRYSQFQNSLRLMLAIGTLVLQSSPSLTHFHSLSQSNTELGKSENIDFRSAAIWHSHIYLLGLLESPPLTPPDGTAASGNRAESSIVAGSCQASVDSVDGSVYLTQTLLFLSEIAFDEGTEAGASSHHMSCQFPIAFETLLNRSGRLQI